MKSSLLGALESVGKAFSEQPVTFKETIASAFLKNMSYKKHFKKIVHFEYRVTHDSHSIDSVLVIL